MGDARLADTTFLCEALRSALPLVRINCLGPLSLKIQVPKNLDSVRARIKMARGVLIT